MDLRMQVWDGRREWDKEWSERSKDGMWEENSRETKGCMEDGSRVVWREGLECRFQGWYWQKTWKAGTKDGMMGRTE